MGFFDPNIEKMKSRLDVRGLCSVLRTWDTSDATQAMLGGFRTKAAEALGDLAQLNSRVVIEDGGVQALIAAMGDKSDFVRSKAITSLGYLIKAEELNAVEQLGGITAIVKGLDDQEERVRDSAAKVVNFMIEHGYARTVVEANAIPALQRAMRRDINSYSSSWSSYEKSAKAIGILVEKGYVAKVLENFGIYSLTNLFTRNSEDISDMQSFNQARDEAAEAILRVVRSGGASKIVEAPNVISILIDNLDGPKNPHPAFPQFFEKALIEMALKGEADAVVPALIDAFKHDNKMIRGSAIWIAGDISDERVIEPLEKIRDTSIDQYILKHTRRSLEELKKSGVYKREKLKKAKNYELALRYEDAAQLYEELGIHDKAGKVRKLACNQNAPQTKVDIGTIDKSVLVKDSVIQKSIIGQADKFFSICPYCGKELNFPKPPFFCPYCREPLQ